MSELPAPIYSPTINRKTKKPPLSEEGLSIRDNPNQENHPFLGDDDIFSDDDDLAGLPEGLVSPTKVRSPEIQNKKEKKEKKEELFSDGEDEDEDLIGLPSGQISAP